MNSSNYLQIMPNSFNFPEKEYTLIPSHMKPPQIFQRLQNDMIKWEKQLLYFISRKQQKSTGQLYRVRVKIECKDLSNWDQLTKSLLVHITNSSPYIQIYNNIKQYPNDLIVNLACQKYIFTLRDIFNTQNQIIKNKRQHKNKMPIQFFNAVMKSVLNAYKYILYVLNRTNTKLYYAIIPQNILICQGNLIKLGYIGYKQYNQSKVIKKSVDTISGSLRNDIMILADKMSVRYTQIQHKWNDFQKVDDNTQLNLKKEMKIINSELKNFGQNHISCQQIQNFLVQTSLDISDSDSILNAWHREKNKKVYQRLASVLPTETIRTLHSTQ